MKKLFLGSLFLVFLLSVGMVSAKDCSLLGIVDPTFTCSDDIIFPSGHMNIVTSTSLGTNFEAYISLDSGVVVSSVFLPIKEGTVFTFLSSFDGTVTTPTATTMAFTGSIGPGPLVDHKFIFGSSPVGLTQPSFAEGSVDGRGTETPVTAAVPEFSTYGMLAGLVVIAVAVFLFLKKKNKQ